MRTSRGLTRALACGLALGALLSGCATTGDPRDPFEPVNRVIFGFNEVVDLIILRPVSHVYRTIVPQPLRTGVAHALHNFATPIIFANDVLQGRPDRAKTTAIRFLVNSTAGFGGVVDAAADFYATVRDIYAQRRAADIANSDFGAGGFDEQGFTSAGTPGEEGAADSSFESLEPIPTE